MAYHFFSLAVGAILSWITLMTPSAAGDYRLVSGDTLTLRVAAQGIAETITVDLDGRLRLVDVGGLEVRGLTLDEAEDLIEKAIGDAGLYVDLRVTLALAEHAPLFVVGDVGQSGSIPFLPGMTVATALAVSGGRQAGGVSRLEIERARNELEGQLKVLNLQIATAAIRMARTEAALRGEGTFHLPDGLAATIPNPAALDLAHLLQTEQEILSTQSEEYAYLLTYWEREIDTIGENQSLFAARIALQNEIIERTAAMLADAQELQNRGLQTSQRLNTAEQRAADAQARVLELESARVATAQALADAQRERTRFVAATRQNNLQALHTARVDLQTLRLRHAKSLENLALLSEGQLSTLLADSPVSMSFRLQSPREGRNNLRDITLDTPLLPGDTLFVEVALTQQGQGKVN